MFKLVPLLLPPTAYNTPFTTPTAKPYRAVDTDATVLQLKSKLEPDPQTIYVCVEVGVFVTVGVNVWANTRVEGNTHQRMSNHWKKK
jgi:nucleoside 2-deoxyribosyltransferase